METKNLHASLKSFIKDYSQGLKIDAPVKTGRLRDSIFVKTPTLSKKFKVDTNAISYAIYANNKHHFVEKHDEDVESFATNFLESLWDDFFDDNETPKT